MFDVLATPEEEMMLGGPNWLTGEHSIVEIDESKFGKRKFHVGHMVEGVWVVGLIERSRPGYKGKFVVEKVADRSADTLEMLILKYVRPGSCLYSDKWKGYRTYTLFEQQQLLHRTVNHTYNFKDPVTGVHTNTIEGMWGHMKSVIPRQSRTEEKIEKHLWEFMWRRTHADLWDRFMHCLKVTRYDIDGDAVPVVAPLAVAIQVVEQAPAPALAALPVDEEIDHDEYIYENNCIMN